MNRREKMHERTKASKIPQSVKEAVYERDGGACILCKRPVYVENSCCHFIGRGRLGLGIEENILTLCHECHYKLDNGEVGRDQLREYLKGKYPGWDEKKLVYTKWGWTNGEDK